MSKRAANEPTSLRDQFESLLSQIKDLYKEASDRCDDADLNDELWEREHSPSTGRHKESSTYETYQERSDERTEIYKRHEKSLLKFKAFSPKVRRCRRCLSDLQFDLGTQASVSLLQRFKEASPPLALFSVEEENISWEDARDYLGEIKALIDEGLALLSGKRDEEAAAKPSSKSAPRKYGPDADEETHKKIARNWGMHLTPEAPRYGILALEGYSPTLGGLESASPSGFKFSPRRAATRRNEPQASAPRPPPGDFPRAQAAAVADHKI